MSQRGGTDTRPASSSGLTGSPPTPSRPGTATSATGYTAAPAGGNQGGQHVSVGDEPWRSAGMPRTNGPYTQSHHVQQHQQQRSFGVQHILNPSESYAASPMAGPARLNEGPIRSPSGEHHTSSPRRTPMPLGPAGLGSAGQHDPNFAATRQSPSQHPSPDRGSPVAHPKHPALDSARRILTPRSPRAASISHTPGLRAPTPQQQHQQLMGYPPATGPPPPPQGARARTFSSSAGGSTPEQSPRLSSAQPQPWNAPGGGNGGGGPSRLAPYSTPPRSVSQPVTGAFGFHGQSQQPYQHQQQQQQQGGPEGRSHQLTPSNSPYSQSIPPSTRGPPSSMPPGEASYTPASSAASPQAQGQIPARPDGSSVTPTGQAYMAINPLNGEQMLVPIETYQASKVANEKRNRNAGASARFRARKKDREQHKDLTLQRLETHNRELEMRVAEQEEVIQHYRSERDRLRDIVHNTAQISHLAYRGPASPVISRAPESLGGASSAAPSPVSQMMPHPSMLGPAPGTSGGSGGIPPEYMSSDGRTSTRRSAPEPLDEQRETRRRRTEGAPAPPPVMVEFGTPNYGPASTPGSLPPIPSPSYSTLSNPGTPSGNGVGRPSMLPPLRMDQPGVSVTPEQHHQQYQGHPSATVSPYRRETYESGWATAPPREGHPPPPPSR